MSTFEIYQICARRLALGFVVFLLLSTGERAAAQGLQLKTDNISAAAGVWSVGGNTLLAVAGQPSPLRVSSNESNILIPGWMATLTHFTACSGSVIAGAEASGFPWEGSEFDASYMIDMSGVPAPDDRLGSFTGSLSWDPALIAYVAHTNLQSGFVGIIDTSEVARGFLEFNGVNPLGAAGVVPIFGVHFKIVGAEGDSAYIDLEYSDMVAAGTFQNLLACLTTEDLHATIGPASPCLVCGDVNGDSTANSSDALIILTFDVGLPLPAQLLEKIAYGCGDVNADGATGSSDALIILSHDVGLPVPFPVGVDSACGPPRPLVPAHEVRPLQGIEVQLNGEGNPEADAYAHPASASPAGPGSARKRRPQQ